jgi:hypothetical protein
MPVECLLGNKSQKNSWVPQMKWDTSPQHALPKGCKWLNLQLEAAIIHHWSYSGGLFHSQKDNCQWELSTA